MEIKNYTFGVDVYTSLGEIQGALAGHGARKNVHDWVQAHMALISEGKVYGTE